MIKVKTEPNPEVVRKTFTDMAKELVGTHLTFDVKIDSDKRYSFLTFHEDGGEPGDLEHLQVHQGKSPFRSWSDMVEKSVSLKDIMKLVERTRSEEMNFFTPWKLYHFLMTVTLSKWEKICVDAFGVIEKHLKNIIKETSQLIFYRFQTTGFASAAEYLPIETLHLIKPHRSAALDILDELAEETRYFIAMYCSWETSRPFTQNDDYMDYLRARISEYMCQHRYAVVDVVPGLSNNSQNQTLRPPPVGLEGLFGGTPRECCGFDI